MRLIILFYFAFPFLFGQINPLITFSRNIAPENSCGGFQGVKQTSDGGYVIAGCVDDKAWPVWVAKLDSYGDKEWENIYNAQSYGNIKYGKMLLIK